MQLLTIKQREMKRNLLIISSLFIILSCSKDDDIGSPEAIFCECNERTEVYDLRLNETVSTDFRSYNGACNESGTETRLSNDGRFQTTIITRCQR